MDSAKVREDLQTERAGKVKLFQIHSLLTLALLSACSTASISPARRPITLSDLERLRPGRATIQELRLELGAPEETINDSASEEVWVYNEPHGELNWQRASFTIDKRSGEILASVLLLREADTLHDLDQATRYFSASHFVIKDEGWSKRREYSDDTEYSDSVNGISMTVRRTRNTVSDIGFWQPSKAQAPLAARKKSS